MQGIHKHLTPDDFVIVIRPIRQEEEEEVAYEEGSWTGEVQVSIITNVKETTLTEVEFHNMLMLCNFAAAAIPAMEENVFVRDLIHSYAQKNMIMPTPEKGFTSTKLTFDTATEGTA